MSNLLKLALAHLISLTAYATVSATPPLNFTAKDFEVVISERPLTRSLPERTLAVRAYSYVSPQELTVSWSIQGDKIQLVTTSSNGSMLDLPKNFKPDQKQLTQNEWQLGRYSEKGFDRVLIISIKKNE